MRSRARLCARATSAVSNQGESKFPLLLLRSTSRNFPLDLVPELERAGHRIQTMESLDDFIASPARAQPFLAVLEIGSLTDLDRALIVLDWTEQVQPLAPGRYLLLLASKHLTLGEKAHRLGSNTEVTTLPQPARNLLFKLELQGRLLASQGSAEKKKAARGFSTKLEPHPDDGGAGRRRILVARGQDEKAGQWRMGEASPQGKVRWRWIHNPDRERPGEKEDYQWLAEAQNAPLYDKKLEAWVIEGDAPDLLCFRGEMQVFSAAEQARREASAGSALGAPAKEPGAWAPRAEGEAGGAMPEKTTAAPEREPREDKTKAPKPSDSITPAGSARKAADSQAASLPERAPAPGADSQAPPSESNPAIARLKEQLQKLAPGARAKELSEAQLAGAEEKPEGGSFSQAQGAHPPAEASTERPLEEEKAPTERALETAMPASGNRKQTSPAGDVLPAEATRNPAPFDPEDFSRSASVPLLPGEPEERGPSRPETAVFRGTTSSLPFQAIPSRNETSPALPKEHRIASETARPETGKGPLRESAPSEGNAPGEAPKHAPSPEETSPEPPKEGIPAQNPTPAGRDHLPATSVPGGAFDSHLPPLAQEKTNGVPKSESQPTAAAAQEPSSLPPVPDAQAAKAGPSAPPAPERVIGADPAKPDEDARSVKGSRAAADTANLSHPYAAERDDSRRFLRNRLFLLMTLTELSDKDSSWHPVGKFRIYLSARHRYYGLPHPGDVLPLWVYEGELAPEFIDEQKSWKFYDRLPLAIYSLEMLPQEVAEYIYKMAGLEPPQAASAATLVGPATVTMKASAQSVTMEDQNPDHYAAEQAKGKRGILGRVKEIVKKIVGR
jgi:hypothetical protein